MHGDTSPAQLIDRLIDLPMLLRLRQAALIATRPQPADLSCLRLSAGWSVGAACMRRGNPPSKFSARRRSRRLHMARPRCPGILPRSDRHWAAKARIWTVTSSLLALMLASSLTSGVASRSGRVRQDRIMSQKPVELQCQSRSLKKDILCKSGPRTHIAGGIFEEPYPAHGPAMSGPEFPRSTFGPFWMFSDLS